jgi:hypothetical protein
MNWAHVLAVLLWGFAHKTAGHGLYLWYLNHHALALLRSGVTSGSGGRSYLHWLAWRYGAGGHGISPRDW